MSELLKTIGQNVRKCRLRKKFTQAKLAQKAGFHCSYISLVERGKRNFDLDVLYKLATALGENPKKLVR